MSDRLYFVSLIARALQQPDPTLALLREFEKIASMGSEPRYANGYRQFLRFAGEIRHQHERNALGEEATLLDDLVAAFMEHATEMAEKDLRAILEFETARPSPRQEDYEHLWSDIRASADRPPINRVVVVRDETILATVSLGQLAGTHTVGNIVPGNYRLMLETGRVLWEGRLSERDVVWSHAFPSERLQMAAETDQAARAYTRDFTLLRDELTVRILPGFETGSMTIAPRGSEN